MSWSYRILRIAGTDVKVHVTFLLLLVWQGLAGLQAGGAAELWLTVGLLVAVFTCVLLHEFGHILMAKRFGIRTPDVILLPIGGLARLERMPEEPRQELLIAVAGPVVTLGIALAFYGYLALAGDAPSVLSLDLANTSVAALLMRINVMLLLFNLLPAFPMDGGRMFRALLAMKFGFPRATRTAAAVGQFLAFSGGMYGLVTNQFILVLIAFFVFLGAGAEVQAMETKAAGMGIRVGEMMMTRFQTIPVHAPLQRAVQMLLDTDQKEFPAVDNDGRIEGLLSRDNLIAGLSQRGPQSTVAEAMTPRVPGLHPNQTFEEAVSRLRASGVSALPVLDESGRIVGLLSLDNVAELVLVRRAVGQRGRHSALLPPG